MILLILSIPALFVGPVLARMLADNRGPREFGDGFILVSIGGLVLFHILPESIHDRGWPAFIACALGLVMPLIFHYAGPPNEPSKQSGLKTAAFAPVLLTALAGVGAHAFLDGMALVHGRGQGDLLAIAVVLHRISVGLTIWWILRPAFGTGAAVGMLVLIALLTPAGFFLGSSVYNQAWFALFQAFMAGSLLHVIYRTTPARGEDQQGIDRELPASQAGMSPGRHVPALLGALAGFASVVFLDLFQSGAPGHGDDGVFAARFISWITMLAPGLLLVSVAGTVWYTFARGSGARKPVQSLRFGFFELPARTYPWFLLGVFVLTLVELPASKGLYSIPAAYASGLLPPTYDIVGLMQLFSVGGIILILISVLLLRGPRDFLDQITLSRKHG